MRRLRYLASAKADLLEIMTYIAAESGDVAVARRFIETLREQCRKLANLPGELGRARPELRPDIRSFAFRGYVIFFRYVDDAFEVINVLEGHRDIEIYFDEPY
jgi:Plasmid stabilization system protein